jgi:hypothetical protein
MDQSGGHEMGDNRPLDQGELQIRCIVTAPDLAELGRTSTFNRLLMLCIRSVVLWLCGRLWSQ